MSGKLPHYQNFVVQFNRLPPIAQREAKAELDGLAVKPAGLTVAVATGIGRQCVVD